MNNNYLNKNLSVHCGKESDGFDKLKELCANEAEKCLTTISVSEGECVSVSFWTADTQELIGIGKFRKSADGRISYDLDFSETTL